MQGSSVLSRLDSLTGLRAVAAFAVFFGHSLARVEGQPRDVLQLIGSQSGMGVTFFFVLSGFVLTWSRRDGDTALPFFRRRFARIYPAYFVALLAGLVVTVAAKGIGGQALPFLASATLTQSWIPDEAYYFAINGVNWSLSCEAFFYLAFPLLIGPILKMSDRARRVLQIALVLGIFAAVTAALAMGGHVGGWFFGHFPLARSLEFVLGITGAIDVMRGQWRRVGFGVAGWVALGVALLAGAFGGAYANTALPSVPFLLVIIAAANRDLSGQGTFFSNRKMVWLGEISFCFYLIHQLAIRAMSALGDASDWTGAILRILLALTLSTLGAWALHAWVERPMERRLRGKSRRKPPLTVSA